MKWLIIIVALSFCACANHHIALHIENPGDPCLGPHNHSEEDDHDDSNFTNMSLMVSNHPEQTRSFYNHKEVFDVQNQHYELELSE